MRALLRVYNYRVINNTVVFLCAQVKKGSGLNSASARAYADHEIDEILKVITCNDLPLSKFRYERKTNLCVLV